MSHTEWIVPCNPTFYDIETALKDNTAVVWRHNAQYEPGDIVYIYVSKGISAIRFKTVVVNTNTLIKSEDDPYWVDRTKMSKKPVKVLLKRMKEFNDVRLSYSALKEHGLKSTIQGPQKLNEELKRYIGSIDSEV